MSVSSNPNPELTLLPWEEGFVGEKEAEMRARMVGGEDLQRRVRGLRGFGMVREGKKEGLRGAETKRALMASDGQRNREQRGEGFKRALR